jgi:hypothetical protein
MKATTEFMQAQWEAIKRRSDYYIGVDTIYSTVSIGVNTLFPTSFSFFTAGITDGLTYAQTNLDSGSRLNNNDIFLVREVAFEFWKTAADADLNFLLNGCSLDWWFYGNRFLIGKVEDYPGGSQAYTTAVANLGTSVAVAGLGPVVSTVNGIPGIHNAMNIGEPGILLQGNDSFKAVLSNQAAPYTTALAANGGTGLTMTAKLRGYRARQIS